MEVGANLLGYSIDKLVVGKQFSLSLPHPVVCVCGSSVNWDNAHLPFIAGRILRQYI